MLDVYKVASELKTKNQAFVIAIVVKSTGSSPGKAGFKILVKRDGTSVGTIGGGAIEAEVVREAKNCLTGGENKLQEYFLSNKSTKVKEDIKIIPMSCNGGITIYSIANLNINIY